MLRSMTVAEASVHTAFLIEEDATERMWQVWLTGAGEGQTFEQFKAERLASMKAAAQPPRARPLRPGEEAANLAFAAQYVKSKEARKMTDLFTLMGSIGVDTSDGKKALGDFEKDADSAKTKADGAFGSIGSAALKVGGVIAGAFAVGDLVSQAASASDATDKFKKTLDFSGIDTSTIDDVTKKTQAYADATVYDLGTIQNTTAQLAANGIPHYEELTEAVGNLNAVAGGSPDTFKSVAMVLTQTAGAGKLTTENWNQLADAIPGASGVIQKQLQKNGAFVGNFRDAMAKGEITSDEFNKALMELGSQPVAKEAATSTSTFEGALGNLEATITGKLSKALTNLKPTITGVINGAGEVFGTVANIVGGIFTWASQHKGTVEAIGIAIGTLVAVTTAYNIAQAVTAAGGMASYLLGLLKTIPGVSAATKAYAAVQWLLNAAMDANPIGLIIIGIAALIAAIVILWTKSETFRNIVIAAWNAIKDASVKVWKAVTDALKAAWDWIVNTAKSTWDAVLNGAKTGWNAIKTFFTTWWNLEIAGWKLIITTVVNLFTGAWNGIKTGVTTAWNAIKSFFTTWWNNEIAGWKLIITTVKNLFSAAWNAIKTTATTVWNGIKTAATTAWNGVKTAIMTPINAARSLLSTAANGIRSTLSGVWNGIKSTATSVWNGIKGAITGAINGAKNTVSAAINAIKGFFSFKINWPHIPLPHFSVRGSANPLDWLTQGVPSIGIDWYAKGGVLTKPTVFGGMDGRLMAGGEAGPEAVAPISVLQGYVTQAVAAARGGSDALLAQVRDILAQHLPDIANMQLVTDTGALVGALTPNVNRSLGRETITRGRGAPQGVGAGTRWSR